MSVGDLRPGRRFRTPLALFAILAACAAPTAAQTPDAELKGLTTLGVVVEGLGSGSAACGLQQDAVEQTMAKILTDAGFKVVLNTDEDTYLYINVKTLSIPPTTCVSRFDATVYTYTTGKLPYSTEPALMQVSLMTAGGITGGAAAGHSEIVLRNLRQYVDRFVGRIRAANK
jgi:hypothetical protein